MGVDLSLLESLTRELLEAEAHRRGIKSPEFRTRGELVRLILRHQYGGQLEVSREALSRSVQTVRFVRAIVGSALSALPELDLIARLRGGEPPPMSGEPRDTRATEPAQQPVVGYAPARSPELAPATEPLAEPAAPTALPTESTPAEAQAPAPQELAIEPALQEPTAEPAPQGLVAEPAFAPREPAPDPAPDPALAAFERAPTTVPDEPATGIRVPAQQYTFERAPTTVPDQPVWPQPVAAARASEREAVTRTFELEPIRTRSMARLLAAQGHRERALAIYEELLVRGDVEPGSEPELRAELSALRSGGTVPHAELPKPAQRSGAVSLPEQRERLVCEGEPGKGLTLRWDISDAGTARARAVLGASAAEGELTLRLVAIHPDPDPIKVVRSEVTEHGPVSAAGEWSLGPLREAARCVAAIGLRAGDRFVSIVHALPTG